MTNRTNHIENLEQLEIIQLIYEGTQYFCVWYCADTDGLLVAEGKLMVFASEDSAQEYLNAQFPACEKTTESEPFDFAQMQLTVNHGVALDPCYILTMWNLIEDIAVSLSVPFVGKKRTEQIDTIYDKLFFGNNLPAVNLSGKIYAPVFTRAERKKLDEILRDGLKIIQNALPHSAKETWR